MDDTRANPKGRRAEDPAYDREIDARAILRFGVGLAVVIGVVLAGTWMLAVAFKARSIAHDPPPSPLVEARLRRPPPEPRLQPAPRQDLRMLREQEDERLRSYAWVDRASGIARIPVDRAVEILLETGLPAVAGRQAAGRATESQVSGATAGQASGATALPPAHPLRPTIGRTPAKVPRASRESRRRPR